MGKPVQTGLPGSALVTLLRLVQRARDAESLAQLRFMLVNETHALTPYRQAMFWREGEGVRAISGVVQVEANAPLVLWVSRAVAHWRKTLVPAGVLTAESLPPELAEGWAEWLPKEVLWVPQGELRGGQSPGEGGVLYGRDLPWTEADIWLVREWAASWWLVYRWREAREASWWAWWRRPSRAQAGRRPVWRNPLLLGGVALGLLALWPVRLSVYAPGELVAAQPAIMRAPIEGVVAEFFVQPNQAVEAGQRLFAFDELALRGRLQVGQQALLTAEAEYRQATQQALIDVRHKASLAPLAGKVAERRIEVETLMEQLERTQVVAPVAGLALFDDPTEWIGRPVNVGERIMRIAPADQVEIEAWLGLADVIPLPEQAEVTLFLNATPLQPVRARLRYLAHEALWRPEGDYRYRMRAGLLEPTAHRVGLKGTVRIHGGRVPAIYWILRRPWAAIRAWWGF
jgi:hypothetical protein